MINKSPGPDNISASDLRTCVGSLKQSFECGDLPPDWNTIFKKGDKFVASNFRPVSLISLIVKAMESIIYDQVMQFFLNECLIPMNSIVFSQVNQSNRIFCVVYSTGLQTLTLVDLWTWFISNSPKFSTEFPNIDYCTS